MNINIIESSFNVPLIWWIGTLVWFCVLLTIDLFLHKKSTDTNIKRAIINTIAWFSLAFLLGAVIWIRFGQEVGLKYFSGYLIEESLSIDNIFVWGILLTYFAIPNKLHYKVLFYGVFGAIIFRSIFVFLGIAIISTFQVTLLLLGALVMASGIKLFKSKNAIKFDPQNSFIVKLISKVLPVSNKLDGDKLVVKTGGKYKFSLLFFVICVIELTDIAFAIDSVPSVIAIVRDPYIVLASNISAILGLRSLYFIFESLKNKFWFLNKGLAVILFGIGIKLIVEPARILNHAWFNINISTTLTLSFIVTIILFSILISLYLPKKYKKYLTS